MLSTIVTHCLAVWNNHSNHLEQVDKDFFDAHAPQALSQTSDEFAATHVLVALRLEQEGYSSEEAHAIAQRLLNAHVQNIANVRLESVVLSTTTA